MENLEEKINLLTEICTTLILDKTQEPTEFITHSLNYKIHLLKNNCQFPAHFNGCYDMCIKDVIKSKNSQYLTLLLYISDETFSDRNLLIEYLQKNKVIVDKTQYEIIKEFCTDIYYDQSSKFSNLSKQIIIED
jgi:hypothetical protein